MAEKVVAKGAEAVLYRDGDKLIKLRIEKKYRTPELDARLRKFRTQREAKLLENAGKAGVPVPRLYETDVAEKKLVMEYISGRLVKDVIDSADEQTLADIGRQVGVLLCRLHAGNIIHNDLTSSNMICSEGRVFLIDFGLAFTSTRIEDKAVDLVVFRRALFATHARSFEVVWNALLEGYGGYLKSAEVLERANAIEKRGRYS
jgi:N6-L-threonylcarbamoyladenine synthase/protein kinase Bud32